MTTHNARNERVKREYLTFLKEAKRLNEASIDGVAAALHRFEAYTGFRDFRQFHIQQAIGFKRRLANERNERTGKPLSKSTLHTILSALKTFFQWLSGRLGYKSRVAYADAEYFNLTGKEIREAKVHTERPVPTIEQILHVLCNMPSESEIELRDRAVIAFTLLTGARDGAIASMKLKHVDLVEGRVIQDAREVRTKFSKTFSTYFFPVGDEALRIVEEWVDFLRTEKLWGNDDPLFPATEVSQGNNQQFRASGLASRHWSTASPIREIFRKAFDKAGLPYFHPHSFRKTLASARRTGLPLARGVQGVEPESRARARHDDVHKLRGGVWAPPGGADSLAVGPPVRRPGRGWTIEESAGHRGEGQGPMTRRSTNRAVVQTSVIGAGAEAAYMTAALYSHYRSASDEIARPISPARG